MAQLREIKNVRQDDPDLLRKWFTDDNFWDLYIWFDKKNKFEIVGVQLCYNINGQQKALTWFKNEEFSHCNVSTRWNSQGIKGSYYGSPILVPDGYFNNDAVLEMFLKDSTTIDKDIASFVGNVIQHYINP